MKFIKSFILNLVFSSTLASPFIVEFSAPLENVNINNKSIKIEKFDNYQSDYFDRLYTITTELSKEELKTQLSSLNVLQIDEIHRLQAMGVEPANENTRVKQFNDSLLKYQWAFASQGQEIYEDLTDITSITRRDSYRPNIEEEIQRTITLLASTDLPIQVINQLLVKVEQLRKSSVPSDINILPILNKLNSLMKKEVKVAVIDSGVDIGHGEINQSILKNPSECNEQGQIDSSIREDNDNNGLPGDCMGWNFTASIKNPLAKFPQDNSGHGTHVAGIISSAAKNERGIVGVSDKIKIIPIKVLFEDEASENATLIAFSDRLARGILYAIKRKADVINLSLGWHKVLDTRFLRNAIAEATNQGITVIAAAGNNNTKARIYPCAYPNVICVGATSIDSSVADFSNFGGAVDIFAPGDNILSLHTFKTNPLAFNQVGFEIRSGTSQATPFVSGTVALLKSIYPEITLNEIKARLFSSSFPLKEKKNEMQAGLFGRLNVAGAIENEPKNHVIPLFKLIDEVPYRVSTKKLGFNLPIQSLLKEVTNVKVSISSTSDQIQFKESEVIIEKIDKGRAFNIPVEAKLKSIDLDREVTLTISVETNGETKSFQHRINLVRVLVDDPALKKLEVNFKNKKKPLLTSRNGSITPLIKQIDQYDTNLSKLYFLRRNSDKGIELTLFKNTKNELSEQANSIVIPKGQTFNNAKVLDIDNDGTSQIFIQRTQQEDDKKKTILSFYNEDGTKYYDKNNWILEENYFEFNNSIKFFDLYVEGLGNVKIPTFLSTGRLPEEQQPKGFFVTRDDRERTRLYVILPTLIDDKVVLKTKSIDTEQFYKKFKEDNNLYWNSEVKIVSLTQDNNSLNLTIAAGNDVIKKLYQFKINEKVELESINKPTSANLVENDSAVLTKNFEQNSRDISLVGFIDQSRARVSFFNDSALDTKIVMLNDKTEFFEGHIANFIGANNNYSIFQTNKNIYISSLSNIDSEIKSFKKRIEKFDFIPGQSFSQFFNEITYIVNGETKAALYLDSSRLGTNSVHVLTLEENEVIESARLSFLVPPNCKIFGSDNIGGSSRINLLCVERDRNQTFKFIELDH